MTRSITQCIYESSLEKFKIISLKGKICSSGFGVSSATTDERQNNSYDIPMTASSQNNTGHYLFIEEVLYLHERGVLEAYSDRITSETTNTGSSTDDNAESKDEERTLLSTSNLYELMLHTLKVPLAVYLTYSHLRSQTYIVLRHTTQSFELLKAVQEEEEMARLNKMKPKENETKDNDIQSKQKDNRNVKKAKMLLRRDQFHAPIPLIVRSNYVTEDSDTSTYKPLPLEKYIAFDVFHPNSNFRKTNPGLPDFCVAICLFNDETIKMNILRQLAKNCKKIPLKICTVSDGGSIAMFGVSVTAAPCIKT